MAEWRNQKMSVMILTICALALAVGCARAEEPGPTASPSTAATATVEPTATNTPVPECLLPEAPPAPAAADHVLTGGVGVPVSLDAAALLGADPSGEVVWGRADIAPDSSVYASAHPIAFADVGSATTTATFPEIGTYRVALTVDGQVTTVDVRVTGDVAFHDKTHGIAAADLFEHVGSGAFELRRDDPECQERAFDHALSGVIRTGAELINIAPVVALDQVDPEPRYVPVHNSLSLTDDAYYAELIGAMKRQGLRVFHNEQDGPSENLSPEQWAQRDQMFDDPAWMAAWFDELRAWVLPRAARAEAAGVDIYGPFNSASVTLRDGAAYDAHWRALIADIREVFSGEIATWLSLWADERFTFADAVDVAVVDTFAAFFTGRMAVPTEPTMAEARAMIGEWLDASEAGLTPVPEAYIFFGATSANGQSDSEDQAAREGFVTDFQEQALYFEALLAEVNERDWVDGVLFGSFDWFDQYQRPEVDWYFDATNESSSRSKPAEQVLQAWYGGTG